MYRLFFVLISLFSANVFATDITDLYQVSLPVASQSEADRLAIAPRALSLVLLKVMGDRAPFNEANKAVLLNQAADMIQRYQYRYIKPSDSLTEPAHLEVILSFNERLVNQALADLKLPYWGKSRPDVLMWIALDNEGDRMIIGADNHDLPVVATIMDTATKRGLPVVLPLMDMEDRFQVKFADIRAGFFQHIMGASARYGAPVIATLSIEVAQYGGAYIRWQLIIDGRAHHWQSSGELLVAIQAGVEELTDRVAQHFARFADEKKTAYMTLAIHNVDDYAGYVRIMNYLSGLTVVADLRLAELKAGMLTLTLSLAGDLALFNRTLAIDKVLNAHQIDLETNVIHYSLLP